MTRLPCTALAYALAACSAPQLDCPDTTTTTAGASCSYPAHAIAIDGDLADWDPVPSPSEACTACRCTTCTAGQVVGLRGTRTDDGNVALLVETDGEPASTSSSYLVSMFPLEGPQYALAVRAVVGGAPTVTLAGTPVAGVPVQAAAGGASSPAGTWGLELEIPIDALPFAGGFGVNAELEQYRLAAWDAAQAQVPTIATCWDAGAPVCQPY